MPKLAAGRHKMDRCHITQADLERYGGTYGCKACQEIYSKGKTPIRLNEECRSRIYNLMEGDAAGRAELERSTKKVRTAAGPPGVHARARVRGTGSSQPSSP